MPAGVEWTEPEGGFFVWVDLPESLDAAALLPEAIERGVAYLPGELFLRDGGGEGSLRLSFSHADIEAMERGVQELGETVEQSRRECRSGESPSERPAPGGTQRPTRAHVAPGRHGGGRRDGGIPGSVESTVDADSAEWRSSRLRVAEGSATVSVAFRPCIPFASVRGYRYNGPITKVDIRVSGVRIGQRSRYGGVDRGEVRGDDTVE